MAHLNFQFINHYNDTSLSFSPDVSQVGHKFGTHLLSPLQLGLLLSFIRFEKGQEKRGLSPVQAPTAAFPNSS